MTVLTILLAVVLLSAAFRSVVEERLRQAEEETTISAPEDFDQDGMPDWWENQYGLNPDLPTDAFEDLDEDGFSNLEEYTQGTNPANPLDFPSILRSELNQRWPAEGTRGAPIPLFTIKGVPYTGFVRMSVGEVYRSGMWSPFENATSLPYEGEYLSFEIESWTGVRTNTVSIAPVESIQGYLPTLGHPVQLSALSGLLYFPSQESFYSDVPITSEYTVQYSLYSYNETLLESASVIPDPRYLQLPDEITPRTLELASELIAGLESPYERAEAIANYLRANYTYDENYTRAPENWDPVDWFLFEEQKGVCTNFNSAFVILARAAGLPARMVFGYAVDSDEWLQTVNASQAHAIAEVCFEGLGWVSFDATGTGGPPVDLDGDGMSDVWERDHLLNPYDPGDAYEDPDLDGYPNLSEYEGGTDPWDLTDFPTPILYDTDGDGIPDWWERSYLLNPYDPSDADQDFDNDGVSNLVEYISGTDPWDPSDAPLYNQTTTRITSCDTTGVKGELVTVRGTVKDEYGSGVDDMLVLIYLMRYKGEDVPPCAKGLTENGLFEITFTIPENVDVGEYYVCLLYTSPSPRDRG